MDDRGASAPDVNVGLHVFAVVVACATLLLIVAGAMVTSTGAGLSVPDWPTTYGQNMFTYPPSRWVGGIFYEHGHRLIASGVGFLTIILTAWMWLREPRRWLRFLGIAALAAVIAQGILGGLTVLYLLPTPISVAHACLAQTFFCLTVAIAVFTSPRWIRRRRGIATSGRAAAPGLCLVLVAVVFCQLILGAVMRHTESGLAVLGFPLDYEGRLFPDMGEAALERYNEHRRWDHYLPEVTASQMVYHMAHRIGALAVVLVLSVTSVTVLRRHGDMRSLAWPAVLALVLVGAQLGLGAWTVWSQRNEYVTSAHVAVGAATLGTVWIMALQARGRLSVERRWPARTAAPARAAFS